MLVLAGCLLLVVAALVVVFRVPLSRHAGRVAARDDGINPKWVREQRSKMQGSPVAMVWNAFVLILVAGVMITFGIFGR